MLYAESGECKKNKQSEREIRFVFVSDDKSSPTENDSDRSVRLIVFRNTVDFYDFHHELHFERLKKK